MADMMHAAGPTGLALAMAGYLVFRLIRLLEEGRRQLLLTDAKRVRKLRNKGA